jgi:hypothetical protein
MERGGCLYPCARRDQSLEHAPHDDYLALRLSEERVSVGTKRAVGYQRNTSLVVFAKWPGAFGAIVPQSNPRPQLAFAAPLFRSGQSAHR